MAYPFKKGPTWYIAFKDRFGQLKQKATTAGSKTEAKRMAVEKELKEERIRLGIESAPLEPSTFAATCEKYLKQHAVNKRSRIDDEGRIRNHLRPHFGEWMLEDIKPGDITEFLASKNRDVTPGAPLSPQTCEHLRILMQGIFTYAIENELYRGLNPARPAVCPKVAVPEHAIKFLEQEEILRVIACVDVRWRGLFATAVYTGMRKGELCGLKVECVDMERRFIRVEKSYTGPTKGKRKRIVAIPDELVPFLQMELGRVRSEWLFPNEDGSMQTEDFDLAAMFKTAMKHAGIVVGYDHVCRRRRCDQPTERRADGTPRPCPKCGMLSWPKAIPKDLCFKDLRSTFGTHAYEATGDMRFVQSSLGHRHIETTEKHYSHLQDARRLTQANKLRFIKGGQADVTPAAEPYPALTMPFPSAPMEPQPRGELPMMALACETGSVARPTGLEPVTPGLEGRLEEPDGVAGLSNPSLSLSNSASAAVQVCQDLVRNGSVSPAKPYPALTSLEGGRLVTVDAVADLLRVSRSTVDKMVRRGELYAIKVGVQWRVRAPYPERLLLPEEAAQALGLGTHRSSIWEQVQKGHLEAIRIGEQGLIRFDPAYIRHLTGGGQ